MANKFNDLRNAMTPEAQIRSHEKALGIMAELSVSERHQAPRFSQEKPVSKQNAKQPAVTKIEKS